MKAILLAVALVAQLQAMQSRLETHAVDIYKQTGINAFEYSSRIVSLVSDIQDEQFKPKTDPRVLAIIQGETALELSLDEDILSGTFRPISTHPGATVSLLRMMNGLPPQPLGIYVPRGYSAQRAHPLVLMLHGAGEPETNVVALTQLQSLADASGAIIAAPWVEGTRTFDDPGPAEVFAALDAVQAAFRIDPRHTYLAGISMGGAGALHIATLKPGKFTAVLSIIGELNPRDLPNMRMTFAHYPIYLVNGGSDPIMTPQILAYTAHSLSDVDEFISIYLAPEAGHSVLGVATPLAQAWNDMFAGTIRSPDQNAEMMAMISRLRQPATPLKP